MTESVHVDDDRPGAKLTARVAAQILKDAIMLERLVIGEATERLGNVSKYDFRALTVEERWEIKRILENARVK